jgi:V/A-type H+-transporting ATPase subunit C
LADIEIDKTYFGEMLAHAESLKDDFVTGYIRLLIDSANLRIAVRSVRTGRDADFLKLALIGGGDVGADAIEAAYGDSSTAPFSGGELDDAARLGAEALKGGTQTLFELACDNAALRYFNATIFIGFGPAPVLAYLAKLEWEITAARMILTGKLTGIAPDVIRERLRDCHV